MCLLTSSVQFWAGKGGSHPESAPIGLRSPNQSLARSKRLVKLTERHRNDSVSKQMQAWLRADAYTCEILNPQGVCVLGGGVFPRISLVGPKQVSRDLSLKDGRG